MIVLFFKYLIIRSMANTVPFEKRETPKDVKETTKYKLSKILNIVLISLFVIGMCFGALVIFHSFYYSKIFVSGQSMYPSLNLNAKNAEGSKVGPNGGDSGAGYRVEFGIVDKHSHAIKNIKRGDIIITYYPSDYDSEGNLIVTYDSKGNKIYPDTKIKRVVGFAGETIGLDADGELLVNGNLTKLRGKRYYNQATLHTLPKTYGGAIPEGYIFVMGDNRAGTNSSDSRTVGPIKIEYVQGVFVAREGTCTISYKDGHSDCVNDSYIWPEFGV